MDCHHNHTVTTIFVSFYRCTLSSKKDASGYSIRSTKRVMRFVMYALIQNVFEMMVPTSSRFILPGICFAIPLYNNIKEILKSFNPPDLSLPLGLSGYALQFLYYTSCVRRPTANPPILFDNGRLRPIILRPYPLHHTVIYFRLQRFF